ncbi:MAG: 50S ribosomal protein L6 [Ferruginibacter sp.]
MSRIGKKPVGVPAGVTITVGVDNVITVKGPKGELKQAVDRDIKVEIKDGHVELLRPLIKFVIKQCTAYIVHW